VKEKGSAVEFEKLLSKIHQLGYNFRHFGYIVAAIDELMASALSEDVSKVSNEQKEGLGKIKNALIIEGVARTLKNLVTIYLMAFCALSSKWFL
jgi:hypothetical protein